MRKHLYLPLFTLAASTSAFLFTPASAQETQGINKIEHVIVIYMENHSFDNLFGEFPGADGLSNAGSTSLQVDSSGAPYRFLPVVSGTPFPDDLTNKPFDIDTYVPNTVKIPDLVHKFYQEQIQIDGGKMDKFALVSDARGLSMGYYHTAKLPLAREAKKYVLCDNFFHSAFGGSFLNHIFFIAAAPPEFHGAPEKLKAILDGSGKLIKDGSVTPDGYAVNTLYSVNQPYPATAISTNALPNQTMPTIGDRLSEKHISWVWYSGGWNDAISGHADPLFQYHHQPFAYFANYADGKDAKTDHLKDEKEFLKAAKAGKLPGVSFVKPIGEENEHPGYSDVATSEKHAEKLINAVRNGPNWKNSVIIVTYDENGGLWDHVAPPKIDRWGPGSRVPAIIISPFAKKGFIDHTQYETVSIISLIEHRWSLAPLGRRDAAAAALENAFKF